MSQPARSGESGYWARRVEYARETRLLSGYVRPLRSRPTQDDLDPHKRPPQPHERAAEREFYEDMTGGLDEAHCRPGHPAYQPRRT